MKVAIITERVNIALGGAERSVLELMSALSTHGVKAEIIAATGQTDARNIHLLYQTCSRKHVTFSSFERAIKQFLSENHYDIIHSVLPFDFIDIYQPRGGTYAETIVRNAASYQNKFMTTYKRLTAFCNFRRASLLRAERRLSQDTNGPVIVAISQYVADQFQKHYGTSNERIVLIPNGISTSRQIDTRASDRLRTQILMQLHIKEADDPALFLFVANNFRLKGLAPLIKALQFATTHLQIQKNPFLIIAGSGKQQSYYRLAKSLNVHRRLVFLGPIRHIQNVLSIVDAAILPTFYDPSSRFILEAIAEGKPVITTRFNGATDLFTADRHGKVINKPENIEALASAISYFTHIENINNASQAIAADNLKERVSVKRVARQLMPVYETILQRKTVG